MLMLLTNFITPKTIKMDTGIVFSNIFVGKQCIACTTIFQWGNACSYNSSLELAHMKMGKEIVISQ